MTINFIGGWNQTIPLMLWVWIPPRRDVLDTTLCDKVCKWLATGQWFSLGTPVSSTNITENIVESGVKHLNPSISTKIAHKSFMTVKPGAHQWIGNIHYRHDLSYFFFTLLHGSRLNFTFPILCPGGRWQTNSLYTTLVSAGVLSCVWMVWLVAGM